MTVILVMVILVKIVFTLVKILHYNKYLYLYIVSQMTESEIENDHFDLDHFDHAFSHSNLDKNVNIVHFSTVYCMDFQ